MVGRTVPERTCVGCRAAAPKPDLLRVVAAEVDGVRSAVPDLGGRLSGRGASVHPVLECLALAERRRAFPRALRVAGSLDLSPLRDHVESLTRAGTPPEATVPSEQESACDERSMSNFR